MKVNEGGVDRGIRAVLGIALLAFALFSDNGLRWWGLIGILPLVTAAMGWCPLYSVLGISTCPAKEGQPQA